MIGQIGDKLRNYFTNILKQGSNMSMDNHIVIMAGGIGSRFWPMSTPECPKQFIEVRDAGVRCSTDC